MTRAAGMNLAMLLGFAVLSTACGEVRGSVDSTSVPDGDRDGGGSNGGGSNGGGSPNGGNPSGGGTTGSGATNGSAGDGAGNTGPGGTGTAGTGTGGNGAGGGTAISDAGAAPDALPPGVPPVIFERPTVWIGEIETTVTYPGDPLSGIPQRVVLVLDAITGAVTGSVTFGSGAPPAAPTSADAPYPAEPRTWQDAEGEWPVIDSNWIYSPYDGFEYSILSSELRGNRLTLSFAPVELWRDWCVLHASAGATTSPCSCTAAGCGPAFDPSRKFDLVVNGDTMEGELARPAGNWLGEPPGIRLRRVR
jgi:hypothetical protein